ncbi:serine hydrolase [Rhodococcus sp. T2V]|uniref:serine hydrolase domain-containing protein n=1 Tax=Rhodococcus sp. T2V TaxID=3034164 RepID=UPI0023E10FE3|nr:serine hydrolase domain-containing protein [Rhodococcus sp. T2V]MDF3310579.1 serine hydrolase [Rhodococcus sp. T2V]
MTQQLHIDGTCASGFELVKHAFEENFRERGEVGASLAIYVDGQPVVDLWGGLAADDQRWRAHTATLVYSATKGVSSVLVHLLADRGLIGLDKAVADYWPEFGVAGKDQITVRQLLSHQAGLPYLEPFLTRDELFAGKPAATALASQTPIWEPGTGHGYHALTFGWLVGEMVARVTGETFGSVLAREVAAPLGLDLWVGVPDVSKIDYAPLRNAIPDSSAQSPAHNDPEFAAAMSKILAAIADPNSTFSRTFTANGELPTPDATTWNDPRALAMEQPAASAVTNGRSLARLYAACVAPVDGIRLLSDDAVEAAAEEQVNGPDLVAILPSRIGVGFQLDDPGTPLLTAGSFGHPGAGGALGFADREHKVGFGYAQNQLGTGITSDPRTTAVIDALRRSLS